MRRAWVTAMFLWVWGCADPLIDETDGGPSPSDVGGEGQRSRTLDASRPPNLDLGLPLDRGVSPDARPDRRLRDRGLLDGPALDAPVNPSDGPLDPPDCPLGHACNPIVVNDFPQSHAGNTALSTSQSVDRYSCAAGTDESGPEVWYAVDLDEPGTLTVTVEDGDGVDIDVHLLSGADGDTCVDRNDSSVSRNLMAGRWFVVADTWVNAGGNALAGAFDLTFDFRPQGQPGNCAAAPQDLRMFWRACANGIDCVERGGEYFLRTPSVGPVVKEAHLVTDDDGFGNGWPSSSRQGLDAHYARTAAATGYQMNRREAWAPSGEGGSEYGQGSTGRKVPVLDEAWYVNMYWRDRPAPGTRMRIRNPANGRTVVASGGYETGPGANTAIGGVTEEIHDYLGSNHLTPLEIGFLADQDLPLGPIECE